MKNLNLLFFSTIVFLLVACEVGVVDTVKQEGASYEVIDWHSQSNAAVLHPEHLSLDIVVDFDNHQIRGVASWDLKPDEGTEYAIFDTWDLTIEKVEYSNGEEVDFELGDSIPFLGRALKIPLKEGVENLKIHYASGKDAIALQWMEPSQTFGKEYPYLYTQGETIYTRSWVPCPDGPGFRFTYDARVQVPAGLTALMSAENPQERSDDGLYTFKMDIPIPAYLMALAVGDIDFKAVDERTGVYAEPAIFAKAYNELDEIDEMVNVAEGIYGKYRWGRYDVLVLPSGFPIGGMENPRLTFATPTILAGDKSLTNLIAHELAHSWSGNLVTNASWDDFWLNEGFTTYFEHRIMEALHGKEYVAMLWDLSRKVLEDNVAELGADSRHTWLQEDLKGLDPDEGFTDIPYEKGSAFLYKIEQVVGRERWDAFVMKYFDEHAFQTMSTDRFVDYIHENLLNENEEWASEINLDAWIFGPGVPDNYPYTENPRFARVDEQVEAYVGGGAATDVQVDNWSTFEWLRFLHELPEELSLKQMAELDAAFDFTNTGNSEIADNWFLLSLRTRYEAAFPAMKEFLYVTGRGKFLEPLYGEMMKTDWGEKLAAEIYEVARPNYHPLTQKTVDSILNR